MGRAKQKLPRSLSAPQRPKTGRQTKSAADWRRPARLSLTRIIIPSLTAVIVLTLAAATILAALSESSNAARQKRIDHAVTQLFAGIPQKDNTLGAPTAPIMLQIFGDLECHQARRWMLQYLPAIIEDFVRPGTLKIQYRAFKTDTIWPTIFINQETAALAAGAQDKMWNYLETFYHEQGIAYTRYATEKHLDGIAAQIPGLNLKQWQKDRQDGRRSEHIAEDDQTAKTIGFLNTPAFLIGPTSGKLHPITGSVIVELIGRKYPVGLLTPQDIQTAINNIKRG